MFEINKCKCGGTPRLGKHYYETTEKKWVEETLYAQRSDGTPSRSTHEVLVAVPSVATRHFIYCPRCKKMTDDYGTKTRAVNGWNNRDYDYQ